MEAPGFDKEEKCVKLKRLKKNVRIAYFAFFPSVRIKADLTFACRMLHACHWDELLCCRELFLIFSPFIGYNSSIFSLCSYLSSSVVTLCTYESHSLTQIPSGIFFPLNSFQLSAAAEEVISGKQVTFVSNRASQQYV